jgi:hypothetical protein
LNGDSSIACHKFLRTSVVPSIQLPIGNFLGTFSNKSDGFISC